MTLTVTPTARCVDCCNFVETPYASSGQPELYGVAQKFAARSDAVEVADVRLVLAVVAIPMDDQLMGPEQLVRVLVIDRVACVLHDHLAHLKKFITIASS